MVLLAVSALHGESLLDILVGAAAVGLPALLYTIWRNRKMGPLEENELVSRMAQQAVSAADAMLTSARQEREELMLENTRLKGRCRDLEEREERRGSSGSA